MLVALVPRGRGGGEWSLVVMIRPVLELGAVWVDGGRGPLSIFR